MSSCPDVRARHRARSTSTRRAITRHGPWCCSRCSRIWAERSRLVEAVAERIAGDIAAGHTRVRDPGEVARALVWMNERYLRDRFGRGPSDDPARVAAALTGIWTATVYRANPPPGPA